MMISASEFKARCLELLDVTNQTGNVITITKHGKVVAELHAPTYLREKSAGPGLAKGKIRIVGDVLAPTGEDWEALK